MRHSCRDHGWDEPEFTLAEIVNIIRFGTCARTGTPFSIINAHNTRFNPFAPSPDRADPTKGYTKENVQWVCNWYNQAKGELNDAQVWQLCKSVVEHW